MKKKRSLEDIKKYGLDNPDGPTNEQMADFLFDELENISLDKGIKSKMGELGREEFKKMMNGIEVDKDPKTGEMKVKVKYVPERLREACKAKEQKDLGDSLSKRIDKYKEDPQQFASDIFMYGFYSGMVNGLGNVIGCKYGKGNIIAELDQFTLEHIQDFNSRFHALCMTDTYWFYRATGGLDQEDLESMLSMEAFLKKLEYLKNLYKNHDGTAPETMYVS